MRRNRRTPDRGLPKYVRPINLAGGRLSYAFNLPGWVAKRQPPCPVGNEKLGTDRKAACARAEDVLLPAFHAWLNGDNADSNSVEIDDDGLPKNPKVGTVDWMFVKFKNDRLFHKRERDRKPISEKQKRNHRQGFKLVGGFKLADGRRFGSLDLNKIATTHVDDLYDKLLVVKDKQGNVIEGCERTTTVNHAMRTCRRAFFVVQRHHAKIMPVINPFAKMGLASTRGDTPKATYAELQIFREHAIKKGHASLATAALIAYEWLQREQAIFCTFDASHYRPKEHPDAVCIQHPKTGEETWFPLFDLDDGTPLYPELMAELDAIKRERISGLMLRRDWGRCGPWATLPKPNQPDLTHMSRKVKEIIRAAGLREELTFASFRHGGFTETGDAGMTEAEQRAQGGHSTGKVLPKYVARTLRQVAAGQRKRLAIRTKGAQPGGNLS